MSSDVDKSTDAHGIHHVNFPITDPARTEEWYGKAVDEILATHYPVE